ncbi:hypothetical protein DFP94_110147 [Fontibacillus phaseoli]|uniref:Uncharacterized protein n=1 Tax=Fontibacillus phaseoli TaxID=1416533 RepID=A0A369B6Y4_9BACL|nr:hypothetical protein DFP94_110147 [Fontibacillus phaseoli]
MFNNFPAHVQSDRKQQNTVVTPAGFNGALLYRILSYN